MTDTDHDDADLYARMAAAALLRGSDLARAVRLLDEECGALARGCLSCDRARAALVAWHTPRTAAAAAAALLDAVRALAEAHEVGDGLDIAVVAVVAALRRWEGEK